MFIQLTNPFDNFVVINAEEIESFEMCELPDKNLGIEITLKSGRKHVVQECLREFRKVLEIIKTRETK